MSEESKARNGLSPGIFMLGVSVVLIAICILAFLNMQQRADAKHEVEVARNEEAAACEASGGKVLRTAGAWGQPLMATGGKVACFRDGVLAD